ncbi:ThuA domain-containing protein [Streptomyces sp. NPDC059786]|uniref:ThuA domain-containing protein n=1 Tax=Streptomyces sp. NPDC059786 TaxID=3346946 RepID=UPI003656C745
MRATARVLTSAAAAALLLGGVPGPAASVPAATGGNGGQGAVSDKGHDGKRVLVFSKTAGFRHDSIPEGVAAVRELGAVHGFGVDATEDAGAFTARNLARYDAVVFMSTTGDVLDDAQQRAFERYIGRGGAYVGVHAAADTEYDWAFYGGLAGAYFQSHPAIQPATVRVEDRSHPATSGLDPVWNRTDEWYNYRSDPRDRARVLASLDESSYSGGTMNGDHPIAWCQHYRGGRAFYTGGGHTEESYADPAFRQHLLGGIRWAVGEAQADCRPENGYRPLFDGTAESLAAWKQAGPGTFTRSDDGTLTSSGGMGMLWYAASGFGSYSLKLDWRMAGDDNSGVFVGFPASDDPWSAVDNGYEIQIDATDAPDRTTGSVYSFQSADTVRRDRALNPPGEWNTYEIRVEGERLRVFLNGVKINDFTNTDPARSLRDGHLGIQNHGADDQVSFRNIRIRELPARSAAPGR